jgi:hypothetical protein
MANVVLVAVQLLGTRVGLHQHSVREAGLAKRWDERYPTGGPEARGYSCGRKVPKQIEHTENTTAGFADNFPPANRPVVA